jgi:hypothetical protein
MSDNIIEEFTIKKCKWAVKTTEKDPHIHRKQ